MALKDEFTALLPVVKPRTTDAVEIIDDYGHGPYVAPRARRFTPYAERVAYAGNGRHHAQRRGSFGKWALSKLRDLGDALVGSFMAVTA